LSTSGSIYLQRGALFIALFYLILGLLWIFLSDNVILFLNPSLTIEKLTGWQHAKGAGYIVVTSVLLYFMVKQVNIKMSQANSALHESRQQYVGLVENLPAEPC
jgi:hypothetical protein